MKVQWTLLLFTLFVGMGAGTFFWIALDELRGKSEKTKLYGSFVALGGVGLGAVASYFHLGHPERIFHILGNLSSGISQEFILASLLGVTILIFIYLITRETSQVLRKVFAGIGLVLSVLTVLETGMIYYLPARPAWHTFLLPLIFMSTAAVLSLFVLKILEGYFGKDDMKIAQLNKSIVIALGVQVLIFAGYLVHLSVMAFPHESRGIGRLLAGDVAWIFWIGVVVLGILVPFGVTSWKKVKLSMPVSSIVGFVSTLVGGASIRAVLYLLGTSIEQFL